MENIQPNGQPTEGQANNNTQVTKEDFDKLSSDLSSLKSIFEKAMEQDDEPIAPQAPIDNTPVTDIWEKFDKEPPKSYKEIKEAVRKEMEETARQQQAQQQEAQTIQQRQRAELNKRWDNELNELERAGLIPPVKNKLDKEDAGVKARTELFELAADLGSANLLKVYEKAYAPSKKSATRQRASAPVGGSSGAPASSQAPSNRDYRSLKMPIEDAKRKYFPDSE